jgi:hypothetical protein
MRAGRGEWRALDLSVHPDERLVHAGRYVRNDIATNGDDGDVPRATGRQSPDLVSPGLQEKWAVYTALRAGQRLVGCRSAGKLRRNPAGGTVK